MAASQPQQSGAVSQAEFFKLYDTLSHTAEERPFAKSGIHFNSHPVVFDRILGRGGFGTVYRAYCNEVVYAVKTINWEWPRGSGYRDLNIQRDTVVKGVRQQMNEYNVIRELHLKTFKKCQTFGVPCLRHPNIIFPWIQERKLEEAPFCAMVMELMEGDGTDLSTLPFSEKARDHHVFGLWIQINRALLSAHHFGMLHGDVRLANILWEQPNEPTGDWTFKLADWGSARAITNPRGIVQMGPGYQAPEACQPGGYGPASEVFALAVAVAMLLDVGGLQAVRFNRTDTVWTLDDAESWVRRLPELAIADARLQPFADCFSFFPSARPTAYQLALRLEQYTLFRQA